MINQFERYSSLADRLSTNNSLFGDVPKWNLYFFFVCYGSEPHNISDIYVTSEKVLQNLIDKKKPEQSMWCLRESGWQTIKKIKDPGQALIDNYQKKKAIKDISLNKNTSRGPYVRLTESELKRACHHTITSSDGIVFHYTLQAKALDKYRQT